MYINNYDSWQGFGQLRSLINPKQLFLCGLFWVEIPRGFTFFILSTAPPSGLYCCFDIYLAAKPWRITTRYKAWRISDKSAQGLNKAVRSLSGATKTYTIFVSIAGPFSPLNTFSGIMALQERNEVNNYEHYKCGEKIWTEIWRKSGALYLASSATWLHLHLCWNAITGFGVCLYDPLLIPLYGAFSVFRCVRAYRENRLLRTHVRSKTPKFSFIGGVGKVSDWQFAKIRGSKSLS